MEKLSQNVEHMVEGLSNIEIMLGTIIGLLLMILVVICVGSTKD